MIAAASRAIKMDMVAAIAAEFERGLSPTEPHAAVISLRVIYELESSPMTSLMHFIH